MCPTSYHLTLSWLTIAFDLFDSFKIFVQVQAFLARHTKTAPRVHADLNSEQDIFEASREGNVARYLVKSAVINNACWIWIKKYVGFCEKKLWRFSFLSRVEELLAGGDADVEDLDNDG